MAHGERAARRGHHNRKTDLWTRRASQTGTTGWTLNKRTKQYTHRIERRQAAERLQRALKREVA